MHACMQGDVAQREVLQEMFGLVKDQFGNRCTAFVHNAGLLAGFSSMSEYERAPTLERTSNQKLLNPLDAELSRCLLTPLPPTTVTLLICDTLFVIWNRSLLLWKTPVHADRLLRSDEQA